MRAVRNRNVFDNDSDYSLRDLKQPAFDIVVDEKFGSAFRKSDLRRNDIAARVSYAVRTDGVIALWGRTDIFDVAGKRVFTLIAFRELAFEIAAFERKREGLTVVFGAIFAAFCTIFETFSSELPGKRSLVYRKRKLSGSGSIVVCVLVDIRAFGLLYHHDIVACVDHRRNAFRTYNDLPFARLVYSGIYLCFESYRVEVSVAYAGIISGKADFLAGISIVAVFVGSSAYAIDAERYLSRCNGHFDLMHKFLVVADFSIDHTIVNACIDDRRRIVTDRRIVALAVRSEINVVFYNVSYRSVANADGVRLKVVELIVIDAEAVVNERIF